MEKSDIIAKAEKLLSVINEKRPIKIVNLKGLGCEVILKDGRKAQVQVVIETEENKFVY